MRALDKEVHTSLQAPHAKRAEIVVWPPPSEQTIRCHESVLHHQPGEEAAARRSPGLPDYGDEGGVHRAQKLEPVSRGRGVAAVRGEPPSERVPHLRGELGEAQERAESDEEV